MKRALVVYTAVAILPMVGGQRPLAQQQLPSQVPGTFRSTIAVVPVDVRVFDRDGKPVTGLTQADFTVLEDGVPQEIRQFAEQVLSASPDAAAAPATTRPHAADTEPSRRGRTFLIVLGRGRLEGPSKGLTASIQFVREKLLPQDEVAVLAYNRATDFTTDREKIASMLERFRDGHHDIESRLVQRFAGLSGLFGSKSIPEQVQQGIDAIFAGEGELGFRTVPPGRVTNAGRIAQDNRRTADIMLNTDLTAPDERPADPLDPGSRSDYSLNEYVLNHTQTMTDLENIYTGIEYLRYLEGEKHLMYITERGLFLPRLEDDTSLAAMANDARVVLDTIQTGGLSGGEPATAYRAAGVPGPTFTETFALSTLRTMAELTGGQASIYAYADKAMTRIDESTRFQYLIGYAPANRIWDGSYRRITVKVNRRDVTVASRGGYYARQQLVPYNREEFLTYSRVTAAALYPDLVRDIKLKLKASLDRGAGGEGDATVDLTIDVSRIGLQQGAGQREGELTVAVYCADADGNGTGDAWKKIKVAISDEDYKQALRDGIEYALRLPARNSTRMIKVVVYDYRADVVGTALTKFQ
jgi:VWFA-related protein